MIKTAWTTKCPVYIELPSDIAYLQVEVPRGRIDLASPPSDKRAPRGRASSAIAARLAEAKEPADAPRSRRRSVPRDRRGQEASPRRWASRSPRSPASKGMFSEQSPSSRASTKVRSAPPNVRRTIEESDCLLAVGYRRRRHQHGRLHRPSARGHDLASRLLRRRRATRTSRPSRSQTCSRSSRRRCRRHAVRAGRSSLDREAAEEEPASAAYDGSDRLVQKIYWREIQSFLRPGDVLIAEDGTSGIGASGMQLPEGCTFVTQALWGSIGYTLGALLGTLLATPKRRHMLFIGDGSFQLTAQELSTMLRHGLKPYHLSHQQRRLHGRAGDRRQEGQVQRRRQLALRRAPERLQPARQREELRRPERGRPQSRSRSPARRARVRRGRHGPRRRAPEPHSRRPRDGQRRLRRARSAARSRRAAADVRGRALIGCVRPSKLKSRSPSGASGRTPEGRYGRAGACSPCARQANCVVGSDARLRPAPHRPHLGQPSEAAHQHRLDRAGARVSLGSRVARASSQRRESERAPHLLDASVDGAPRSTAHRPGPRLDMVRQPGTARSSVRPGHGWHRVRAPEGPHRHRRLHRRPARQDVPGGRPHRHGRRARRRHRPRLRPDDHPRDGAPAAAVEGGPVDVGPGPPVHGASGHGDQRQGLRHARLQLLPPLPVHLGGDPPARPLRRRIVPVPSASSSTAPATRR